MEVEQFQCNFALQLLRLHALSALLITSSIPNLQFLTLGRTLNSHGSLVHTATSARDHSSAMLWPPSDPCHLILTVLIGYLFSLLWSWVQLSQNWSKFEVLISNVHVIVILCPLCVQRFITFSIDDLNCWSSFQFRALFIMEPVSNVVKVSLANYLADLPLPNSVLGWFRIGCKYYSRCEIAN